MTSPMLEKMARAILHASVVTTPPVSADELWERSHWTARGHAFSAAQAALLALREPDEAFMRSLYPDSICDGRPMTKQGDRSRRAGRMQIAHFIDHVRGG